MLWIVLLMYLLLPLLVCSNKNMKLVGHQHFINILFFGSTFYQHFINILFLDIR